MSTSSQPARRQVPPTPAITDPQPQPVGPRPPLAIPAGWLLVVLSVALVAGQGYFAEQTVADDWMSYRDETLMTIIGLAGLRIGLVVGRHPKAVFLAMLAGVGLVLEGFLGHASGPGSLSDNTQPGLPIIEILGGIATVVLSLVALSSPDTGEQYRDQ